MKGWVSVHAWCIMFEQVTKICLKCAKTRQKNVIFVCLGRVTGIVNAKFAVNNDISFGSEKECPVKVDNGNEFNKKYRKYLIVCFNKVYLTID